MTNSKDELRDRVFAELDQSEVIPQEQISPLKRMFSQFSQRPSAAAATRTSWVMFGGVLVFTWLLVYGDKEDWNWVWAIGVVTYAGAALFNIRRPFWWEPPADTKR